MTESTTHRVPSPGIVAREQLRVVGLSMRREAMAAGVLLVLGLLLMLAVGARVQPSNLDPSDALGILAAGFGLLFPLAVWRGERRFGESQLWLLPVNARRHALLKVLAGWVLLMGVFAVVFTWIVLVVLASDGTFGAERMRLLVVDPAAAAAGVAGATQQVEWTTPWWQWLLPFTAGTAAYLACSAMLLATRHPWWWAGAFWLIVVMTGVLGERANVATLNTALEGFEHVVDVLVMGGNDTLRTLVTVEPSGDRAWAWETLPTFGRWATITAGWFVVTAAALWAAASRRREP